MAKHNRRTDDSKAENKSVSGFESQVLRVNCHFWTDSPVWNGSGYCSPGTWVSFYLHTCKLFVK